MSKPNGKDRAKSNGEDLRAGPSLELPLLELPGSHPCHECGACCRYIALEIDNPTSFTDHDQIYWYLAHRDVAVYVDWEGDWFVEFMTVCEHLTDQTTCGVYEERPKLCSDFSWDECEQTTGERAWKYHFDTPDDYNAWHRERRPRSFERYLARRKKLIQRRKQAQTHRTSHAALTRRASEANL